MPTEATTRRGRTAIAPRGREQTAARPVFGLILPGGGIFGALVRDVRLANELAARGYAVHVWWALDRPARSELRVEIGRHWLFHGFRYAGKRFKAVRDRLGRLSAWLFSDGQRSHYVQKRPQLLARTMAGLVQRACDGPEGDARVVRRFARGLTAAGVTHLLPALEVFAPWAAAARRLVPQPMRYLVTFQGYELYANFARTIGYEERLYERLGQWVRESDWPAIAVSADYAARIVSETGLPESALRVIPPGVPPAPPVERAEAERLVAAWFEGYRPGVPLVTFLGRRDSEKGIDLLLYAVRILLRRGLDLQLAVCGPTAFGGLYGEVCRQIAENLRLPVLWRRVVPDAVRAALFAASRCVAYPSIHREPFGMVPVEAMAYGTPAVVPDCGGVASTIEAEGAVGGLCFRAWDSGDLAEQIARLIQDDALRRRLSEAAAGVAAYYSVEKLADRVLGHLGLPAHPAFPARKASRREPTS